MAALGWVLVEAHRIFDIHCRMWDQFSCIRTPSCGTWDLVP